MAPAHPTEASDPPASRLRALIAFVVIGFLIGVSLWLVDVLSAASKVQDCVQTGGRQCAEGSARRQVLDDRLSHAASRREYAAAAQAEASLHSPA